MSKKKKKTMHMTFNLIVDGELNSILAIYTCTLSPSPITIYNKQNLKYNKPKLKKSCKYII